MELQGAISIGQYFPYRNLKRSISLSISLDRSPTGIRIYLLLRTWGGQAQQEHESLEAAALSTMTNMAFSMVDLKVVELGIRSLFATYINHPPPAPQNPPPNPPDGEHCALEEEPWTRGGNFVSGCSLAPENPPPNPPDGDHCSLEGEPWTALDS
ncbi:hypothetical protein G7Y89_g1207 [Cudoniella acicularis]|uniref:Uncharacterized protein n=1 Tax=Cudoniella acicularis TaxID=354080 RepID=A0A8H4RVR7_9HELO|nr:hypothetical protein G7Y89_g1207 [Cudoniella acicularis]